MLLKLSCMHLYFKVEEFLTITPLPITSYSGNYKFLHLENHHFQNYYLPYITQK